MPHQNTVFRGLSTSALSSVFMKMLVLWDIDLTLIDPAGIGKFWYLDALAAVTGVSLHTMPALAGKTERAITSEALIRHGITPSEDLIQQMWKELIAACTRRHRLLTERASVLPGARNALDTLARQPGTIQSLVTGNLPEIAWNKLSTFDLHRNLDFTIGGYGSLSPDRSDLVAEAIDQAEAKHGTTVTPGSVVVLGDTPDDITAAHHHGASGIGVATGRHTDEDLRECGADAVLTGLTDTDTVLATIQCTARSIW